MIGCWAGICALWQGSCHIMDDHKLRLRFENGLSTSRGENAVRRVYKRVRAMLSSSSPEERLDAAHGLLRDQETLREQLLVQQFRAQKFAKRRVEGTTENVEKRRIDLEAELEERRNTYHDLKTRFPKTETKGRQESRDLLLPASTCETQLAQLRKREEELDRLIHQQRRDFEKWKEMAVLVEDVLRELPSTEDLQTKSKSTDSPASDVEPRIK